MPGPPLLNLWKLRGRQRQQLKLPFGGGSATRYRRKKGSNCDVTTAFAQNPGNEKKVILRRQIQSTQIYFDVRVHAGSGKREITLRTRTNVIIHKKEIINYTPCGSSMQFKRELLCATSEPEVKAWMWRSENQIKHSFVRHLPGDTFGVCESTHGSCEQTFYNAISTCEWIFLRLRLSTIA